VAAELTELIDLAKVVWESRPKHDPTKVELGLLRRHRALPVYGDASGALLLRPDGQVLEVAWGADIIARPADSQRRMIALVSAAKLYPVLRVLLPRRPHRAADCQECGGSGLRRTGDQASKLLCQNCAGLGWIVDTAIPALSAARPG
jgi:hypothetical protein